VLKVTRLERPGLTVEPFTVARGEAVAVRGPSGSGKSLLLRAIADLDPSTGSIVIGGAYRAATPPHQWRKLARYVPAESGWWADRVGDHLDGETGALIKRLLLPEDCPDWPVSRLSTGERQRLALVRALADDPPALLLDEPTAPLDQEATYAVESLIKDRLRDGACALIVTHDDAQAKRLCRRVLTVEAGQVREAARD